MRKSKQKIENKREEPTIRTNPEEQRQMQGKAKIEQRQTN